MGRWQVVMVVAVMVVAVKVVAVMVGVAAVVSSVEPPAAADSRPSTCSGSAGSGGESRRDDGPKRAKGRTPRCGAVQCAQ